MASDPLREVLQKVVADRQERLQALQTELLQVVDSARKAEMEREIEQVAAELRVSQQALQQSPAIERRPGSDDQVLDAPSGETARATPSLAGLEAQIRELQSQLLDKARAVELGGASPNPHDVQSLEETRVKLSAAMQAITTAELPGFVGELPPKPTAAQQAEADNLIRQSRVAKMRGQSLVATDLLRKAVEAAPGAISVLEALGDDLMERGLAQPAVETYAKALNISRGEAGIERKYASAVARSKGTLTIEEALQMKLGDSPLASADAANKNSAAIISFFLPGVGQIVLGDYLKGAALLVAWLVLIGWAFSEFHSLKPGSSIGPMTVIPLVGAFIVQVVAAWACRSGEAAEHAGTLRKGHVERPRPPVDLPFE